MVHQYIILTSPVLFINGDLKHLSRNNNQVYTLPIKHGWCEQYSFNTYSVWIRPHIIHYHSAHWFWIDHLILIMRGYLSTFWPNIKTFNTSEIFQFEMLVYISYWGHHRSTASIWLVLNAEVAPPIWNIR